MPQPNPILGASVDQVLVCALVVELRRHACVHLLPEIICRFDLQSKVVKRVSARLNKNSVTVVAIYMSAGTVTDYQAEMHVWCSQM